MKTSTRNAGIFVAPDEGFALPDRWYVDRDVFDWEQEAIFGSTWQYGTTEAALSEPGDFVTTRAGKVPVVIVRTEDGPVKSFANVCRHRGSILVNDASGSRKSFQCPYHAWTYSLNGQLLAVPGSRDEEWFDPQGLELRELQTANIGPFIFVNPKPSMSELAQVLGDLPALIHGTGVDFTGIKPRIQRRFEINANWKIVIDNYLECYHCQVAHPAFCDLIDVRDYTFTGYDYFSTQVAPPRTSGARPPESWRVDSGFYAYLWPNFTINIYPGPGNLSINLFVPVAPDRTVAIFEYCLTDEVGYQEANTFAAFVDQVQREDTALCESVQIGLASGILGQGRLLLSREQGLRHFHRLYLRELQRAEERP